MVINETQIPDRFAIDLVSGKTVLFVWDYLKYTEFLGQMIRWCGVPALMGHMEDEADLAFVIWDHQDIPYVLKEIAIEMKHESKTLEEDKEKALQMITDLWEEGNRDG